MQSYQDLKDKWGLLLRQGEAACNFDPEKLAPDRFCVFWSDTGSSGACYSSTELIGSFQDAKDFLAFLRFAEIPRILDFDTGTNRDVPDVADAYILKYEGEERQRTDHLIGRLDRVLKLPNGEMISESELCLIRDKFNEAFDSTNPSVQILAWGSLAEVLASDHFEEAFEEAMTDGDERLSTELKALLRDGQFDETNGSHLALARSFLTTQLSM